MCNATVGDFLASVNPPTPVTVCDDAYDGQVCGQMSGLTMLESAPVSSSADTTISSPRKTILMDLFGRFLKSKVNNVNPVDPKPLLFLGASEWGIKAAVS